MPSAEREEVRARVWLPSANGDDFRAAVIVSEEPLVVQLEESGEKLELAPSARRLWPRNEAHLVGTDDLIRLPHLDEPNILHSLATRFGTDAIYTYTGPILIALNPWKRLPLYGADAVDRFLRAGDAVRAPDSTLPPHAFAIASAAYYGMRRTGNNQSVLVSGESGAGKTETTKFLLQFLAALSGPAAAHSGASEAVSIEQRLLESNPILESFGNAKTLRNDNSSRFGKFIEVRFAAESGAICAGEISTYLLEKVRVAHQDAGERNFHAFYQLLAASERGEHALFSGPDALALLLRPVSEHTYAHGGQCVRIDGIDDAEQHARTLDAMAQMGLERDELRDVWSLVAAILHLGDVCFEESAARAGEDEAGGGVQSDGSAVRADAREALTVAANLLGLDPDAVSFALRHRHVEARGETFMVPQTPDQASDARDALAKAIYGQLFAALVRLINDHLHTNLGTPATGARRGSSGARDSAQPAGTRMIGVLDIFGFERFEHNSFEQLCINYANERLQQQFNHVVFQLEQEEYVREGIDWTHVEFIDNAQTLELIDGRAGIIRLLDGQCLLPAGSDEAFVEQLRSTCDKHPSFVRARFAARTAFGIAHYAGEVLYEASGFVDKNRDTLPSNLRALLVAPTREDSPLRFATDVPTSALLAELASATPSAGGSFRAGKASLAAQFYKQLNELMALVSATTTHYVRCINPNGRKAAGELELRSVLHQLRCGGVMDAVRVCRSGFPTRYTHAEFARRYRCLCARSGAAPASASARAASEEVLRASGIGTADCALGATKVFLRMGRAEVLESRRTETMLRASVRVQSAARRRACRGAFTALRASSVAVQSAARARAARFEAQRRREGRAALRLQARARSALAARLLGRARVAATRLAAAWRGACAQRAFHENLLRRAAVRAQALLRTALCRRAFLAQRRAAVAIECAARRRSARLERKRLFVARHDAAQLQHSLHEAAHDRTRLAFDLGVLAAELGRAEADRVPEPEPGSGVFAQELAERCTALEAERDAAHAASRALAAELAALRARGGPARSQHGGGPVDGAARAAAWSGTDAAVAAPLHDATNLPSGTQLRELRVREAALAEAESQLEAEARKRARLEKIVHKLMKELRATKAEASDGRAAALGALREVGAEVRAAVDGAEASLRRGHELTQQSLERVGERVRAEVVEASVERAAAQVQPLHEQLLAARAEAWRKEEQLELLKGTLSALKAELERKSQLLTHALGTDGANESGTAATGGGGCNEKLGDGPPTRGSVLSAILGRTFHAAASATVARAPVAPAPDGAAAPLAAVSVHALLEEALLELLRLRASESGGESTAVRAGASGAAHADELRAETQRRQLQAALTDASTRLEAEARKRARLEKIVHKLMKELRATKAEASDGRAAALGALREVGAEVRAAMDGAEASLRRAHELTQQSLERVGERVRAEVVEASVERAAAEVQPLHEQLLAARAEAWRKEEQLELLKGTLSALKAELERKSQLIDKGLGHGSDGAVPHGGLLNAVFASGSAPRSRPPAGSGENGGITRRVLEASLLELLSLREQLKRPQEVVA